MGREGESDTSYSKNINSVRESKIKEHSKARNRVRKGRGGMAKSKARAHISLQTVSKRLLSSETDPRPKCWFTAGAGSPVQSFWLLCPQGRAIRLKCCVPSREDASLRGTRHPDGHQGLCYI